MSKPKRPQISLRALDRAIDKYTGRAILMRPLRAVIPRVPNPVARALFRLIPLL